MVSFFEEIDRVFNEEQLTDLDMPIWTDYFPEQNGYGEGFFVQVDIDIPEELHDKLQYLPPAPCHTSVSTSSLPPHMQEMYRQRYGEGAQGSTSEKLIASLLNKKDVVLHYSTAEMYARIGAKLKIKKVLRFTQGRILENWIKKATMGRKAAALVGDELLVALYKLIINSVYGEKKTFTFTFTFTFHFHSPLSGKMIETVEAHQKTKLIYCIEDQLDALASPFLKKLAILDDTTLMATFTKENIELNRPVAIGVSILELSKRLMYRFVILHQFKYSIQSFFQLLVRCDLSLLRWT